MRWIFFLFIILILPDDIDASEITILNYREDYRPLETVQAEIILGREPLNDLTPYNLEFSKNNNAIGAIFYLEKLSSKRYFAYFDIPSVESGDYNLKVRDVNLINNGVLIKSSSEITIKIIDVNPGFDYLLQNQNHDGSFGDVTKTSLGALALKKIDFQKANSAISYLVNNQDPTGCFPRGNCNVKDTSFALIALSKFNQNHVKTKNWLKDASNNFEIGLWSLKLEGSAVCGDINLNGAYEIQINNKVINITCSNPIDFILSHSYLGSSYTIHEYTGSNFSYSIDDSGCYGIKYKKECDYISTLYASWALKEINEEFPEDYLIEKKLDNRTIDHALGYILYNDDYDRNWLFNNYLNGYWSYYSSSISQTPDYFTSAIATYSLNNEFLFREAKDYLSRKTRENLLDSSIILYLLFNDEARLPSVSVMPGISNQKNRFNLRIKNNKYPITIEIESPNYTEIPREVHLQNEVNYRISGIKENFEIKIIYGNYSYIIPVIGINQKINEGHYLLPPPENAIKLLNKDVNITLSRNDRLEDDIMFINNWSFNLNDVKLNATGRINDIIRFDKDYFNEIKSNETIKTRIYLNKEGEPAYAHYDGYIIVTSSQKTLDAIKISVNFVDSQNNMIIDEEGTGEEIPEGKIQEGENQTKKQESIGKKKNYWWIWMIIALIAAFVAFLFFRRKKEVSQDFEDYAKKLK